MKNSIIVVSLLLISTSLLLAACGTTSEIQPDTDEKTIVEEVSETPVEAVETDTLPQTGDEETAAGGEEITMFVGPELVDCEGAGPQTCMQVKMNPESDYTLFYDQIEGFEYEPGYEYELRVFVEPVENPPADASSLKYTLVEEVSKTPVTADGGATEGETTPDDLMLEGSTWTLLSYVAPDGQPADVLPDTRITAEFKDGQVAGIAGCNRYFASFETDGGSLTIGPAGSTMMYCSPDQVMLQETAYLATLSTVASYEFIDNKLHLKNANGDTILLFASEEPLLLTGVTWNLVSYNNGNQAMVSLIIGTEITADFGEDGALAGSAGCNSYSASYETEGESITIGPAISTKMFCGEPEGIMEQETQYLTVMQDAAIYRIDGERLEIRDASGAGVAYYEAADPTTVTGITWNLLTHNNGTGGMVSTVIGTEITADFAEDGTLTGSAGCNSYTATYEIDGEKITIGPAASTRKFCAEPEGIMEQESQYLTALENAAVYTIDSSGLDIRDANGSGVVSYAPFEQAAETDGAVVEVDITIPETPETLEADTEAADDAADAVAVPSEITTALGNASYPLDYTGSGTIQLTDGEYRQPAAEDSATEIVTQLTEHVAIGEMSSGEQVVAVILVSQTGGAGTFYDLVVMSEQDGQLSDPASAYLGDRIVINSLTIDNDQIVIEMVVQGPEDPLCCPTQQVIQTYERQGSELVSVSSDVIGTVEPQPRELPEIAGIVWKWQELITPVEQVTIDSPEKYTVKFNADGEVAVSADCNIGGGTYEINGNSISINIMSTTLAVCAEGSYGDLFFRSLESASTYIMDGDNLMIDQSADGGTMRFLK